MRLVLFVFMCYFFYNFASASDKGKSKLSVNSKPYIPIRKELEQQHQLELERKEREINEQILPTSLIRAQALKGKKMLQQQQEIRQQLQKQQEQEKREREIRLQQQLMENEEIERQVLKAHQLLQKRQEMRREKEVQHPQEMQNREKRLKELVDVIIPQIQGELHKQRQEQLDEIKREEYMDTKTARNACVINIVRFDAPNERYYWKCRNLNPELQEHYFSDLTMAVALCIQGAFGKYLCDCRELVDPCLMAKTCKALPTNELESVLTERATLLKALGRHRQLIQETPLNQHNLVVYNSYAAHNNAGPSNIQLPPSVNNPYNVQEHHYMGPHYGPF